MRVTLVQIGDLKKLEDFEKFLNSNSDLFVFPEKTFTTDNYEFEDYLQRLCSKFNTRIVVGVVVKNKNYSYYFSSNKVARYQKVHVHWTEKYAPGDEFKVINTKYGKIGLLICYDAAFQETGRILALKGAKIVVVISVIPATFPYQYNNIRLQSMALNNQVFTICCCKPGKKFTGHSLIYDPKGNLLIELGKSAEIKTKKIDLKIIDKWRKEEKIFAYRRPRLYSEIVKDKK